MIKRDILIDLQYRDGATRSSFSINQGNVDSVLLTFRITDGARAIDYAVFDSARITLSKNGKAILNSPCVIHADHISYKLGPEALGYAGVIWGQLDLTAADGVNLATTYFSFEVVASLAQLPAAERQIFIGGISELIKELEGIVTAGNIAACEPFQFDMGAYNCPWRTVQDAYLPIANASCALYNGKVYLFGCGALPASTTALIFDPEQNTWAEGVPSPLNAGNSGCAIIGDKAYVCGGMSNVGNIQVFDFLSQNWLAPIPIPTNDTSYNMSEVAAVAHNGKIYICGGDNQPMAIRVYDTVAGVWSKTSAHTISARTQAQTAVMYDGCIYLFGCDAGGEKTLCYDIASDTWLTKKSAPVQASCRAAYLLEDGQVFVAGMGPSPFRISMIYDISNDSWRVERGFATGIAKARGVRYNGRLYFFGSAQAPNGQTQVYTPPAEFVRLMRLNAGEVIYSDTELATDSGQSIERFTETTVQNDGYLLYPTNDWAAIITGWRASPILTGS